MPSMALVLAPACFASGTVRQRGNDRKGDEVGIGRGIRSSRSFSGREFLTCS